MECKSTQFLGFPQRLRLRQSHEFSRTMAGGVRRSCGPFVLYMLANKKGVARLGLTVPRSCAPHAHCRNLIKRHSRECFRTHCKNYGAWDMVLHLRRPASAFSQRQIRQWIYELLEAQ